MFVHSFIYNRVNFLFQKRKFDRYIYDDIFITSFKLLSREKYSSEKVRDQTQRSLFSQRAKEIIFSTLDDEGKYCGICMEDCSYLCDPNDSIKGSSYPMNQRSTEIQPRDEQIILQVAEEQNFPTIDNKGKYFATCIEDYSHLSESEDSIKVLSYPMHQGSLKIQPRDIMVRDSFSLSTKSSLNDKPKIDFVKASKSMDDKDLTGGKTSLTLSLTEEDMEVVRSLYNKPSLNDKAKIDFVEALKSVNDKYFTDGKISLLLSSTEEDMELVCSLNNFLTAKCNHLPRPIIPIGPRFQAKISKWEGGTNIKLGNDDDGLKWLGTQIWPIPFISETNI